jgi:hypothetical protein
MRIHLLKGLSWFLPTGSGINILLAREAASGRPRGVR